MVVHFLDPWSGETGAMCGSVSGRLALAARFVTCPVCLLALRLDAGAKSASGTWGDRLDGDLPCDCGGGVSGGVCGGVAVKVGCCCGKPCTGGSGNSRATAVCPA